MFTHFVKLEQRILLGYTLLGCFITFLSYNTIIMLIMLCHNLKLWIKRLTTINRRLKLKQEALSILDKLRGALRSLTQSKKPDGTTNESSKDWFVPEELGHIWMPDIVATSSGGANCIIVERIDPILRRYVSTIVDVSQEGRDSSWRSQLLEEESKRVQLSHISEDSNDQSESILLNGSSNAYRGDQIPLSAPLVS